MKVSDFVLILALSTASCSAEYPLDQCRSISQQAVEAFAPSLPSGTNVVNQLYFTAVVESGGGIYTRQLSGGPALSWFQIEPATAVDVYFRYLKTRPHLKKLLLEFSQLNESQVTVRSISKLLEMNPKFAAGIGRLVYAMSTSPVPTSSWEGHSMYWKNCYQKGGERGLSAEKALKNFNHITKSK